VEWNVQAHHAQQAVFRFKQDKQSKLKQRMETTTKFVKGGVQLVSAAWSQSVSGVFDAVKELYNAYKEYADGVAAANCKWYVLDVVASGVLASRTAVPVWMRVRVLERRQEMCVGVLNTVCVMYCVICVVLCVGTTQ
jgi:hypothetical protein